MKKFFLSFALVCISLSSMFSTDVMAQYRHSRPHHYERYRGDGFFRALDAAERIGEAAMFGSFLHSLDDYTGIRVGYNAASLRTDLSHSAVTSSFTPGVGVGIVFGWQLGITPLIIEPGVYYSMKGGKLTGSYKDDGTRFINEITMHSVEIPLVLKCQLPLSPDNYVSLQPFFGGFLSFGFAGKTKFKEGSYNDSYDTFDDKLFGNTDAGLRMGTGLAVGQFYLELAYDLGLVNLPNSGYKLMDYDDFSDSMKSNTLSFNIGINF